MKCEADCIPDCDISWWRGDEEIPGTYLDGILRLRNVRRDEIHFYTCYASNSIGPSATKLLVLEVICKLCLDIMFVTTFKISTGMGGLRFLPEFRFLFLLFRVENIAFSSGISRLISSLHIFSSFPGPILVSR